MSITYQNSLDAKRTNGDLSQYTHVDYKYYRDEWDMIRDALAGERRVKDKGTTYLPPLDKEYGTDYATYKDRAVFVNMVGRTVSGLVGTVFRRAVKVDGVKRADLKKVTVDNLDFNLFAKKVTLEVCALGRVGVLVDMKGSSTPYLTEYIAENILSWRSENVDGREVLSYVLLREISDETPILNGTANSSSNSSPLYGGLRARYRVLILDNGVYKQRVYEWSAGETNPSISGKSYTEVIPTRNGKPFDFIPFVIIGPLSPTPDVQKSPVYDITVLNYAHYRTTAQLEHGRYYTALPVYYVPVRAGHESSDYHVGPSVVWEVDAEAQKPGILEYYGTGLKSLSDSLMEKEEYIAQLGGRIMGIRPAATSESDNIYRMKQANEMAILLNITESVSAGLTRALVWFLDWQRKPIKDVNVRLNQDFKALQIAARELRALALLYQEGILPLRPVYEALQTAEWLGDDITFEEFEEMLKNINSFPNQPDVAAMHEGYPDAATKIRTENQEEERRHELRMDEYSREHQNLIDQRRFEQNQDVQEIMFRQGRRTAQYEHEFNKDLETHKAKLKQGEENTRPNNTPPAANPARSRRMSPNNSTRTRRNQ